MSGQCHALQYHDCTSSDKWGHVAISNNQQDKDCPGGHHNCDCDFDSLPVWYRDRLIRFCHS